MIRVIDCTLREGCEARQCSFDSAQSVQLAREIAALGVDMIECGHPRISADERERVRAVVAAVSTPVLAHARARREDIDAVLETGAQWVGLFASINAISLETKFKGMSREEVLELFHDAIRYARERGLRVRATVEDAARTSVSDLVSMIATARDAGAIASASPTASASCCRTRPSTCSRCCATSSPTWSSSTTCTTTAAWPWAIPWRRSRPGSSGTRRAATGSANAPGSPTPSSC